METCNAGMPWRCSAPSLVRAESRASSPHPVSWGGAHFLLWSQPSFGLLVSTGDESVGARAGWLKSWEMLGTVGPPPAHTHFLVSSSSTHDASFWRPWQHSLSRLTLMQILMQRGTLLRQRVMRCSSDDLPVVEIMTFSTVVDKDSLCTTTTGAKCLYQCEINQNFK